MNLKKYLTDVKESSDFSYAIRNFLDAFYANPCVEYFNDRPEMLVNKLNDSGLADAWVAASVSYLCQQYDLTLPEWVHEPGRVLSKPWFAAKSAKLRTVLLQESPAAFRVRNLFVSENALSRA